MPDAIYARQRYVPDEIDHLRRRYHEADRNELARELGRTPMAICNLACHLGLAKRPSLASCEAKLRELHGQKMSDRDIARELGVTHNAVGCWRKKLGLSSALSRQETGRLNARGLHELAVAFGETSWAARLATLRRRAADAVYRGCTNQTQATICLYVAQSPAGQVHTRRGLAAALSIGVAAVTRALAALCEYGILRRVARGEYVLVGKDDRRENKTSYHTRKDPTAGRR